MLSLINVSLTISTLTTAYKCPLAKQRLRELMTVINVRIGFSFSSLVPLKHKAKGQ